MKSPPGSNKQNIEGIWNPTIQNPETFEIRYFEGRRYFEGCISNGPVFKCWGFNFGYSCSPNHSKTGPFKIQTFLFGLQMFFDKMEAICKDFKWLGFLIADPIQNPDHLQYNPFLTIQNPD